MSKNCFFLPCFICCSRNCQTLARFSQLVLSTQAFTIVSLSSPCTSCSLLTLSSVSLPPPLPRRSVDCGGSAIFLTSWQSLVVNRSFCRRHGGGVAAAVTTIVSAWLMRRSQSCVSTRPTVSAKRRESTSVREGGRSAASSTGGWWKFYFKRDSLEIEIFYMWWGQKRNGEKNILRFTKLSVASWTL